MPAISTMSAAGELLPVGMDLAGHRMRPRWDSSHAPAPFGAAANCHGCRLSRCMAVGSADTILVS